jgi:hypothetical protein
MSKNGPMTVAQRQRKRQERIAESIAAKDSEEWTDAECLSVLMGSRWRGGAMDKGAWKRLGQLRGFL